MYILTELIERELMCLVLRWPCGQSTIGSQYDKTTYISQSTQISWLGLSGRGGGWWWVKGVANKIGYEIFSFQRLWFWLTPGPRKEWINKKNDNNFETPPSYLICHYFWVFLNNDLDVTPSHLFAWCHYFCRFFFRWSLSNGNIRECHSSTKTIGRCYTKERK